MPTECPGGVWLPLWGREAHTSFSHRGAVIGILIFCTKPNDGGEKGISFESRREKVISVHSYNLDYDLSSFIKQKNNHEKIDPALRYSVLDAKCLDNKMLKSGHV